MMAGGIASVSSVVVEGLGVVTPPTDMGSLVVIPIPITSITRFYKLPAAAKGFLGLK